MMQEDFDNRRMVAEFCDRRQGRRQMDDWLRVATGRPFRTDKNVDGRKRRNMPSSRTWCINGLLRIFQTNEALNYRHHPEEFRADGFRNTSRKELRRITNLNENELRACLREFDNAGILKRERIYVPELRKSLMFIKLNGHRMLEILASLPEVKKARAEAGGDDFTKDPVENQEFRREDIKSVAMPIEELHHIDEPMAVERLEDAAKIEASAAPTLTVLDHRATLSLSSDIGSLSAESVTTSCQSIGNDPSAALPPGGRRDKWIQKGLRDVIVLLGSTIFEGQKVTPRSVKLLTRWYRSTSADEEINVARVLELLRYTRNKDDSFLDDYQDMETFTLFWPQLWQIMTRIKLQDHFDLKRAAVTFSPASVARVLAMTKGAFGPDELLAFSFHDHSVPEYVLGRFLYASELGHDMRPLIDTYGKELGEFFEARPHYYAGMLPSFPVADWLGDRSRRFRVESSVEGFKTDLNQAGALLAHWGEHGVEGVKDEPETDFVSE